MEKDVKGMKKDSALDGQENLNGTDGLLNGIEDMSSDDDWEINIDQLLEQADMLVNNDMLPPMPELEEESGRRAAGNEMARMEKPAAESKPAAEPKPVAAAEANTDMDSDLDEINSLLEQANLNEKIDDDMLALLESATENQADDAFDIFAEGDMPLEDMKSSGVPERTEEKEEEESEQKKKSSKKKKKKKEKAPKKAADKGEKAGKGEKKPGFLAKIVALFGKEEDFEAEEPDTAADENVKILNELNGEGGKAPSKKNAKKKENGKAKKNAKAAKPKQKAKPKKAAPAKKKKEKPAEKPAEKSVKILNGKSFTAIAGLCFSIIAGVMIVTNFLPEYADKQTAKKAFRERDYETVYKLFYDKKLSADEELLFNQSKVIRQMERRLEAYQNNITLGRELEAVDALMRGVENYQDLWEADEYQVRSEVDSLYIQICGILEANYGITREEAVTIASYDKIDYTKALYAIVEGTPVFEGGQPDVSFAESADSKAVDAGAEEPASSDPEEEFSEADPLEDILPEEEDLMD